MRETSGLAAGLRNARFRGVLQDVRYAVRRAWWTPGVTLVAAFSLALGIAANTTIFSFLDGMYLRPLAVPRPAELVRVFAATGQEAQGELSYPEYRAVRAQSRSFSGIATCQRRGATFFHNGERELVLVNGVSPDFFQVLGVQPHIGRLFGPGEEAEPVVLLGHSAWKRFFGGDAGVVGRSIRLARGAPGNVRVVGVLPESFRDLVNTGDRDMWIPPATFAALSGGWGEFEEPRNAIFETLARLRPEASLEQARAELATISGQLAKTYPQTNLRRRLTAVPDSEWRLARAGKIGIIAILLVPLVVAVACVNVANLLLARFEQRRHEIAVRRSLGASRWRLTRQLLLESAVIGALGMAVGLVLAAWIIQALPAWLGIAAHPDVFRLDLRVLGFTALVSALTVLLFGLMPALIGSRTELTSALKYARARGFPVRSWLVLAQVAVSLVILCATGLLVESFRNARHGDIGLAHRSKEIVVGWSGRSSAKVDRALLERIRTMPGVRDASVAIRAPLTGSGGGIAMPVVVPGHPQFAANQPPVPVKYNSVDPRYFNIMGVRLLRGSLFAEGETQRSVVISETMARRYWPDANPVGRFIRSMPEGRQWQIAGVVSDAPINAVGERPTPYFYTSWWQNPWGEYTLLVETERDAASAGAEIRTRLEQADPEFRRLSLSSLRELVRQGTRSHAMAAQLVAALGALALLLTAVGPYGVVAYSVAVRWREIGIRMALGAAAADAARAVLKQALVLTAGGVAVGLPLAMLTGSAMRSTLFGMSPWRVPAFAGAILLLLAVAGIASWLPARRASRLDPAAALRYE